MASSTDPFEFDLEEETPQSARPRFKAVRKARPAATAAAGADAAPSAAAPAGAATPAGASTGGGEALAPEAWSLPGLYKPAAKPRPRPRGLEGLEEQWRRVAEEQEAKQHRRVEATVVPHHLYTGSRGVMSVLRQWGRAGTPATPAPARATPIIDYRPAATTPAPGQKKRPRPAPSPAPPAPPGSAGDPFAFLPSEHPDEDSSSTQAGSKAAGMRRGMRRGRSPVDYRSQLEDLESEDP